MTDGPLATTTSDGGHDNHGGKHERLPTSIGLLRSLVRVDSIRRMAQQRRDKEGNQAGVWFSEVVSLRRTTSRDGFGEGTQAIERGTKRWRSQRDKCREKSSRKAPSLMVGSRMCLAGRG